MLMESFHDFLCICEISIGSFLKQEIFTSEPFFEGAI